MTQILELPKHWAKAVLNEIAEVRLGRQRSPKRAVGENMRPYMRAANVTWDGISLHDVKEMDFTPKEFETYALHSGDILLAEASGSASEVGRPALWTGQVPDCCFQNTLIRVRSDSALTPFLYRFFMKEAVSGAFATASRGVGIHHLGATALAEWPVVLPPLAEQERIVEAIDSHLSRLDAAIAGLERAQANLKRYRASVLRAAVEGRLVPAEAELARQEGRDYAPAKVLLDRILSERRHRWEETELERLKTKGKAPSNDLWKGKYKDPAQPDLTGMPDLPEGWRWASLEQITSAVRVICYGILMPKEHIPNGVLYVKVRDMKGDRLDVNSLPRTSPEIAAKYARASLRTGDLLLAIRGTYGRVVEVPPELDGGNITQDTARLDLHRELSRGYLRAYLLSPDAQNYFKRVARGVAVKGVNIAEVRTTPVSLPPPAEQERILKEVDLHLSLVDELEREIDQSRRRSDRLRQSILASAFAGKLAEQDPSDEPASDLLERITEENQRSARTTKTRSRRRSK